MTKRTRLLLVFTLVAVVLLGFGLWYWWNLRAGGLPEDIHRANGRLELTRVDVAAKYPGRVDSISFGEGDRVKAGQILAVQNGEELRARLEQAEATLARALSEQARARSGQQAQGRKVALAQLEFQQARKLQEQQEISPVELERRRLAMEAESSVRAASGDDVNKAGHAADEARAQIKLAEAMIEELTLRAPISGRVENRLVEPGAMLPPGGRVATMLDPSNAYLTVFYPAAVASRLKIGDEARIVLEGFEGRVLPAIVQMVDSNAQFTPKYVETSSERQNLVFRVKLRIPVGLARELEGQLKGGVTGDGYVRTADQSWPAELQVKSQ